MQLYTIPIDDARIIYRPLAGLAFAGNPAMAELCHRIAAADNPASVPMSDTVRDYLVKVGFFAPDPEPPPNPEMDPTPSSAVLLLTNRCNLRCVYCYAHGGEGQAQDLSLDTALAVIDAAHSNAVAVGHETFSVTFHGGGEPTQAWDVLVAATEHAQSLALPCDIALVSNTVWTEEQTAWIIENIDDISVSFDGSRETQDRQRPMAGGASSFDAVMRCIRAMDRAAKPYGIRLTAAPPFSQFPKDIAFLCRETETTNFAVEPTFSLKRGHHASATREQALAFCEGFKQAFEIAAGAGRFLAYSGARVGWPSNSFCGAPFSALVVRPDDKLVACYELTSDSHPVCPMGIIGYVDDGQIVLDEAARERVCKHLADRRAQCTDCFAYWHCAGDCMTRGYGTMPGESMRCLINQEITKDVLMWYILAGDGVWRPGVVPPGMHRLMATI